MKNYTSKKYSKYSKQGGYYESSSKREQVLFKVTLKMFGDNLRIVE